MKTIDIANRARRSLRNAKARTILTSLAIGVGAFTIAVSLAAGEGARQYADKLIGANINPQVLFIVEDSSFFEGGFQQPALQEYDPNATATNGGATVTQLTQSDVNTLAERSDLEYVTPIYQPRVTYVTFGDAKTKFSTDIATYDPTILTDTAVGEIPEMGVQLADDAIVLPESFADILIEQKVIKTKEELVGMTVAMTASKPAASLSSEEIQQAFVEGGQAAVVALASGETRQFTFEVVGLSKRSATALTGSTAMQISAARARAISEFTTEGTDAYQKYIGVTALATEGNDPEDVKAILLDEGYGVQSARDLQGVIFTIVNTLQGIVLGFGVVALIASVFGIINTQYISVLERTREIGLMKALGMRGRSVSRLFQFEAAWIGFLGGLIGSFVAILGGTLLNPWITETLALGEGNYILVFQPIPIALMVVGLILIAMLAGWFPARKAAKLDPIEALRTE